jgi:hypothetical protein
MGESGDRVSHYRNNLCCTGNTLWFTVNQKYQFTVMIPQLIMQQFPEWTRTNFGEVHFADYFHLSLKNDPRYSIDYLARRCLSYNPFWMKWLMDIRDAMVGVFGLKTGGITKKSNVLYFEKGSVLVYFRVSERTDDVIVLEETDKHLNFRILLQVDKNEIGEEIHFNFSTLVHFNNQFGRVYFALIRPFHILIVNSMINYLRTSENTLTE